MNQQTHTVEKISAADTLSIRQQVLRPSWTIEQCHFEGDQDETTFHIGAFKDGVLIGIATMMRDSSAELAASATDQYRLRGMAVLPEYRDQGVGRSILDECLQEVRQRECKLFWCNARIKACLLYTSPSPRDRQKSRMPSSA